MAFVYLDYEYNDTTEEKLNVVCGSHLIKPNTIFNSWMHKDEDEKKRTADFILAHKQDIFVSWNAVAEGSVFYSLGLDPRDFKWFDLFLEYRCLTNHNNDLLVGAQLVDGKVKNFSEKKSKWQQVEGDDSSGFKPTHSLAEATFKLLGQIRDTDHKKAMRDLIISKPDQFTDKEADSILSYCEEDTVHLPAIHAAIMQKWQQYLGKNFDPKKIKEEMLLRGAYAASTAVMERTGYPINVEQTRNFSDNVLIVLQEVQREINSLFPKICPFKWDKSKKRYRWDQLATKNWLRENVDCNRWKKTDGGKSGNIDLSLSLEAWEERFSYRHTYPTDNFGAQIVRYLKMKQQFNGFLPPPPGSDKKTFWHYVGRDGRVRPYMNIYGAQSSRSQPGSTGFLFLKPAWVRSLCQPKAGRAIGAIDYGSEEFFISALLSEKGEGPMTASYLSGDVYLSYGKILGVIPEEGTKATHKRERDLCKATILGLSYLMSKYGLANKLTADTGIEHTPDEAQEQIDNFYTVFSDLAAYQAAVQEDYRLEGVIELPCGWRMWGDNPNHRSICNVGVQGLGASCMRKAVHLAEEKFKGTNTKIIMTLHDALYIEFDSNDLTAMDKLREAMIEGFAFYFSEFDKKLGEVSKNIRLDPFCWSPDYEKDSEITTEQGWKIDVSNIYIDERAEDDYNKFSKYFFKEEGLDFL